METKPGSKELAATRPQDVIIPLSGVCVEFVETYPNGTTGTIRIPEEYADAYAAVNTAAQPVAPRVSIEASLL